MAAQETFMAQSEAVQRVLDAHRKQLTAADQKHLACAARNLAELDALRALVLSQAADLSQEPVASDRLSEALIRLLHLPISE